MRTGKPFREYLAEVFKKEAGTEREFYHELFKLRVAEKIRELRSKKGFSQSDLAKRIGTSQSTIARLENPDNFSYSLKTILKIADALDMELIIDFKEKMHLQKVEIETGGDMRAKVIPLQTYRPKKEPPYVGAPEYFTLLDQSIG